ncbi:DUF3991 and toprim domain-containing protein [Leuconostoc citreum]|uniref:toprim domain-containing protein n=1 Tax=Leuconostoc citreum TaxID=33964 RepID=UPI00200B22DF|nr:toprim domain-containing protein [Leuconostoc citreum]MCK8605682.1 DUF3991 and toprim domain-containing protein [Leuconostoc citreum]
MKRTKEERQALKKLPIQGYCDWHGIAYNKTSSNELRMVDHDSLVVVPKKNLFVWNSKGINGDLVDFIHYYELGKSKSDSKGDALRRQLDYARHVKGEKIDIDKLYQNNTPTRQFNYDAVKRTKETQVAKDYLVNQRQLNPEFVDGLIAQGAIAQGTHYYENDRMNQNPVIFPWKDVNGKIVGADRQGTEQDFEHYQKRGTSKRIEAGSNTHTGFNLGFGQANQTLVLFESPIDLLSYAQQNEQALVQSNATLLSISGTDAKRGATFLQDSFDAKKGDFNKIIVAFDNDKAGFKAADYYDRFKFTNPNTNLPIVAERHVPIKGKDWNEQLKAGVLGFKTLTMTENAKQLDYLEAFTQTPTQQSTVNVSDQQESALPAKHAQAPLQSPNESTQLSGNKKLTKSQRRKANYKKNEAIIKDAMSKVSQFQNDPKALQSLLNFTASEQDFSARNAMIIKLQRPDATLVKGHKQWASEGIRVNKGEKAMRIFAAPVDVLNIIDTNGERIHWNDATTEQKQRAKSKQLETKVLPYYPIQTVFDVRQTNATLEQLPKLVPERPIDLAHDKQPVHLDNAYQTLIRYADNLKVTVYDQGVDEQIAKRTNGQNKSVLVVPKTNTKERAILLDSNLNPAEKVNTLAHALVENNLQNTQTKSKCPPALQQTQKELAHYVMTKHLGITPEAGQDKLSEWTDRLKSLDKQNPGPIMKEALQASNDVKHYLTENLAQGEIKQVKQKQYFRRNKMAELTQSYQNSQRNR